MRGKVPTKVLHLKTQSEKNDSEGWRMDKKEWGMDRQGESGRWKKEIDRLLQWDT
jgi:hypothetical protein